MHMAKNLPQPLVHCATNDVDTSEKEDVRRREIDRDISQLLAPQTRLRLKKVYLEPIISIPHHDATNNRQLPR